MNMNMHLCILCVVPLLCLCMCENRMEGFLVRYVCVWVGGRISELNKMPSIL